MTDHHTIQAYDENGNKISFAIFGTDFTVTKVSAAEPETSTAVVASNTKFEVLLRATFFGTMDLIIDAPSQDEARTKALALAAEVDFVDWDLSNVETAIESIGAAS